MSDGSVQTESLSPRARDAVYVLFAPRSVYERVEDTAAYGWTFAFLILLTTLLGAVTIQTGLIDQSMDRLTEDRLASLELTRNDRDSRLKLSQRMEDVRKDGEFLKMMARAHALLFAPAHLIASILLISAVLYAAVALSGRKPEYHTLVAICVYASVVELVAMGLRVAMMMVFRTAEVDMSLALLAPSSMPKGWMLTVLGSVSPFQVWFWYLVRSGLVTTWQLGRIWSVVVCVLLFASTCALRALPALVVQSGMPLAG